MYLLESGLDYFADTYFLKTRKSQPPNDLKINKQTTHTHKYTSASPKHSPSPHEFRVYEMSKADSSKRDCCFPHT